MIKQLFKSGQIAENYIKDQMGNPDKAGRDRGKCVRFNGSSDYATLDEAVNFRYDEDWSIEYFCRYEENTRKALMGSTTSTGAYWMMTYANSGMYFYNGTGSNFADFSTNYIEGDYYKLVASFDSATNITTITRTNLTSGVDN